jgi:hypothetical protein
MWKSKYLASAASWPRLRLRAFLGGAHFVEKSRAVSYAPGSAAAFST